MVDCVQIINGGVYANRVFVGRTYANMVVVGGACSNVISWMDFYRNRVVLYTHNETM